MDNGAYVTRFWGYEVGEDILHDNYTITSLTLGLDNHTIVTIANNSSISVFDQIRYTFCLKQYQTNLDMLIPVKVNFTDQLGRLITEADIRLGYPILPPKGATHMDFVVEDCPGEYATNLQIKAEVDISPTSAFDYMKAEVDIGRMSAFDYMEGYIVPAHTLAKALSMDTHHLGGYTGSNKNKEPSKKAVHDLEKFLGGE